MLKAFDEVHKAVHFRIKKVHIDNPVFKLHYVFTFAILLVCTVLVCSRQYIGEHIRCIADNGVPPKVINTFCFFTTTFTVVRHLNGTDLNSGAMVAHPGVGPYNEGEPVIHHAYYQWVPFVLFAQALLFYVPHLVWKKIEGGRVKNLVGGLDYAALAFSTKATEVGKDKVPSIDERMGKIEKIQKVFVQHRNVKSYWVYGLIFGEVLNVVNLLLQIWLMNWFLGGQFISIGRLIIGNDPYDDINPMDVVFPKVTKCNFYKYGPTGTIQLHDALCVMALNVINEKIYVFLWFWFLILLVISVLALLYRLITLILYKRSPAFNRLSYRYCCPVLIDPLSMNTVTKACSTSDLVFLHYLGLSMDGFVFHDFIDKLAKALEADNDQIKAKTRATEKEPVKIYGMAYEAEKEPLKTSGTAYEAEKVPLKTDEVADEAEKEPLKTYDTEHESY